MKKTDIVCDIISTVIRFIDEDIKKNQWKDQRSSAFNSAYDRFKNILSVNLENAISEKITSIRPRYYSGIISKDREELNNPNKVIFYGLDFSNEVLKEFCFDDKILVHCSFRNSKLINCRFRNTSILFCDLRYIDFNCGTFESSYLWWNDIYRGYFQGIIRFSKAIISDTSINNTFFSGATLIRKMNFKDKELLQMNSDVYMDFLYVWDSIRNSSDKIKTDDRFYEIDKINRIVMHRHEELELIFKNLSSTFTAVGFSNDSNWAYVHGKRAEREVLYAKLFADDSPSASFIDKFKLFGRYISNLLFDIAFGYGESIVKICCTYMFIVFVFTFIYMYECDIHSIVHAFIISFKNMVGASNDLPLEDNVLLSMLNVIQTTLGILLTGIFGFILGNKIRNQ